MTRVSVVIPTLNEAETIGSVVAFSLKAPMVDEVVVVDDGSTDGTPEFAHDAGARVLTSRYLGKGASMEDGLWAAFHDVVVFLDGDLSDLSPDLIPRLVEPIIEGAADFVKAGFQRSMGRVTELTARPLLHVFFPELSHFSQPLGGIIAARRSLLRDLRFERDYGVDIGLLLDAWGAGAPFAEVNIGSIRHDPQPLSALGEMSRQVVRTLLDRASRYGRLNRGQVLASAASDASPTAGSILPLTDKAARLALFDLDGVLTRERFVVALARRTNRDIGSWLDQPMLPEERARRIAGAFADVPHETFVDTAHKIPSMPGARETVLALRRQGAHVGIVTDGYQLVADIFRRRVFADFAVGHQLDFHRSQCTGELTSSPLMSHARGCTRHRCCKKNVLVRLLEHTNWDAQDVMAVGDTVGDVCLLESVGLSVAFEPKCARVRAAAKHLVRNNLMEVLSLVRQPAVAVA